MPLLFIGDFLLMKYFCEKLGFSFVVVLAIQLNFELPVGYSMIVGLFCLVLLFVFNKYVNDIFDVLSELPLLYEIMKFVLIISIFIGVCFSFGNLLDFGWF